MKNSYYVEMDARDNSVTLSDDLLQHIMDNNEGESPTVFGVFIPELNEYGFVVNPELEQQTIVANIQHNEKLNQFGFELLCPSVNMIFYRYCIMEETATLEVNPFTLPDGKVAYTFKRP